MEVSAFLKHWNIQENPFRAEEARDDPVFQRMQDPSMNHPDFEKIFGRPDKPSAAVVFGEKGSGKTALRIIMEEKIQEYNQDNGDKKSWVARYDDLNPILDSFIEKKKFSKNPLSKFRLKDHQDVILSLVVTKLVTDLVDEGGEDKYIDGGLAQLKRLPRSKRADLLLLAGLYLQPRAGSFSQYFDKLKGCVSVGLFTKYPIGKWLGCSFGIAAALLYAIRKFEIVEDYNLNYWIIGLIGLTVMFLGNCAFTAFHHWKLSRLLRKEINVVTRNSEELGEVFSQLRLQDLHSMPLPLPGNSDSRYQLTARLLSILNEFDYKGIMVLVDGVDEPTMINGDAEKMKNLIWPMFKNKFLQQPGVGIKLLLPIELRYLLYREDSDFFQSARLDKQSMVDRLAWTGATLYDVCARRLNACLRPGSKEIKLTDLFDETVSRQEIIDALDQMMQPRDAFKFLYQVIHEHCKSVTTEDSIWKIPNLTLRQVTKTQAQRLMDLQRGLNPA